MFIPRNISPSIRQRAQTSPIIGLFGPRQSGKSTLVKHLFSKHAYVNFEDSKVRTLAQKDAKEFLRTHANEFGLIIDEAQRVPDIFSYIQLAVDENRKPGYFILTGSQNYLLMQSVSQSLAGRIALFTLLPFSIKELNQANLLPQNYKDALTNGFYPNVIVKKEAPYNWYTDYITTYIERDVRQLINIGEIDTFEKFIGLCAGRIGQLLNLSSLANDCGISHTTARKWISILTTSYIIFLLQPHYRNFSKRLIKSPKLFFYDPGLACSILGIKNQKEIITHYLRGGLFETMMISDLHKNYYNAGDKPRIYFWRDQTGNEVDCLIDEGVNLYPIEIKANQTMNYEFFKGLNYWNKLADANPKDGYVIYGGEKKFASSQGTFMPWDQTYSIFERVTKRDE